MGVNSAQNSRGVYFVIPPLLFSHLQLFIIEHNLCNLDIKTSRTAIRVEDVQSVIHAIPMTIIPNPSNPQDRFKKFNDECFWKIDGFPNSCAIPSIILWPFSLEPQMSRIGNSFAVRIHNFMIIQFFVNLCGFKGFLDTRRAFCLRPVSLRDCERPSLPEFHAHLSCSILLGPHHSCLDIRVLRHIKMWCECKSHLRSGTDDRNIPLFHYFPVHHLQHRKITLIPMIQTQSSCYDDAQYEEHQHSSTIHLLT